MKPSKLLKLPGNSNKECKELLKIVNNGQCILDKISTFQNKKYINIETKATVPEGANGVPEFETIIRFKMLANDHRVSGRDKSKIGSKSVAAKLTLDLFKVLLPSSKGKEASKPNLDSKDKANSQTEELSFAHQQLFLHHFDAIPQSGKSNAQLFQELSALFPGQTVLTTNETRDGLSFVSVISIENVALFAENGPTADASVDKVIAQCLKRLNGMVMVLKEFEQLENSKKFQSFAEILKILAKKYPETVTMTTNQEESQAWRTVIGFDFCFGVVHEASQKKVSLGEAVQKVQKLLHSLIIRESGEKLFQITETVPQLSPLLKMETPSTSKQLETESKVEPTSQPSGTHSALTEIDLQLVDAYLSLLKAETSKLKLYESLITTYPALFKETFHPLPDKQAGFNLTLANGAKFTYPLQNCSIEKVKETVAKQLIKYLKNRVKQSTKRVAASENSITEPQIETASLVNCQSSLPQLMTPLPVPILSPEKVSQILLLLEKYDKPDQDDLQLLDALRNKGIDLTFEPVTLPIDRQTNTVLHQTTIYLESGAQCFTATAGQKALSKRSAAKKVVDFLRKLSQTEKGGSSENGPETEVTQIKQLERKASKLGAILNAYNSLSLLDQVNLYEIADKLRETGVEITLEEGERKCPTTDELLFRAELKVPGIVAYNCESTRKGVRNSVSMALIVFLQDLRAMALHAISVINPSLSALEMLPIFLKFPENLLCLKESSTHFTIQVSNIISFSAPKHEGFGEISTQLLTFFQELVFHFDNSVCQTSNVEEESSLQIKVFSKKLPNPFKAEGEEESSIVFASAIIENVGNFIALSCVNQKDAEKMVREKAEKTWEMVLSMQMAQMKIANDLATDNCAELKPESAQVIPPSSSSLIWQNYRKYLLERYHSVKSQCQHDTDLISRLIVKGVDIRIVQSFTDENQKILHSTVISTECPEMPVFTGTASTKLASKRSAAQQFVQYLQTEAALPKVELPEYLLDFPTSKVIFSEVLRQWKQLSGLPNETESRKCKVLAAFVVTSEKYSETVRVLSLGTGSKCISSEAVKLNGKVILDSHAEVIARRALKCLLYDHLTYLLEHDLQDTPELILEPTGNASKPFRLKTHLKVHLFITKPPCGASVHVKDTKLRVKYEADPSYLELPESYISNLSSIQEGSQKSTFMSCSDKLAAWNVVGLQGAPLSTFLEPLYLESVSVTENFNYNKFTAAFYGRTDEKTLNKHLNLEIATFKGIYKLNRHKVGTYTFGNHEEMFSLTNSKKHAQSMNWYRPINPEASSPLEIINAQTGSLIGSNSGSETVDFPRISKLSFSRRYKELLTLKSPILEASLTAGQERGAEKPKLKRSKNRGTYQYLKESSIEYQTVKGALVETLEETELGIWINAYSGTVDLFPH